MKRFFKWVGIVFGSFIGVSLLLIVGVVIYDQVSRGNPNRNVEVVRVADEAIEVGIGELLGLDEVVKVRR